MNIRLLTFLIFCLTSNVVVAYESQLAKLTVNLLDNISNKTIAVTDFQRLDGEKTELGRLFAEDISSEIVNIINSEDNIEIFDRLSIENILQEQKLSATGLLNPETTKQIGKITGVDYIVLGTIAIIGEEFKVTAKLLNVETAKISGSFRVEIPVTESLNDLYYRTNAVSIKQRSQHEVAVILPVSLVTEKNGIRFALQDCVLESDQIICRLLITSLKKDRKISLGISEQILKANIIDQQGKSHLSNNLCFDDYCKKQYSIEQLVFADVPVTAVYQIPVSDETKSIAYFSIVYKVDNKHLKISFPSVELLQN